MKTNVLMIILDQLSTRLVSGGGHNQNGLQTNAIDSIAEQGVRFTNSYSSYPLCCPARSSIFTGMMPHTTKILDNEEIYLERDGAIPHNPDLNTIGEILKDQGYATGYFGKEHGGGYGWQGMDTLGSMKYSSGGMLAEGSAFDQIFTKDAIDFIKEDRDKPFYAVMSLINPHDICKVLGGKVKGATFADTIFFCRDDSEPYLRFQDRPTLPENFNAGVEPGMIPEDDYMFKDLAGMDENAWKRYIGTYQLLIEKTDWYIELVLKTLEEQGLEEDTMVVFLTDHGDMMGSHKLIAKTNFYEESVKTHLSIKYPKKIDKGQVIEKSFASTCDIMPTILDYCDVETKDEYHGRSLRQAIENKSGGNRAFGTVFSVNGKGRMVRHQQYKYIISEYDETIREILFDLEKDPDERNNVINEDSYKDIAQELRIKITDWIEEQNIGITYGG